MERLRWQSPQHQMTRQVILTSILFPCFIASYSWWEICIFSFSIPSSFLLRSNFFFQVFLFFIRRDCSKVEWQMQKAFDKGWVTDAKVMTFAVSKCVHNLTQTSNSIGKLIDTKEHKKKNWLRRNASGGRCAMPLPITPSISGWQLILELCFTHWS
jgi:hypothetical protein